MDHLELFTLLRGRGGDAGATFIPDLKIVFSLQHVFPNNSAKLQT